MKKTLIAFISLAGMAAASTPTVTKVAEWNGFSTLTQSGYTLSLTEGQASVDANGVLSVTHSSNAPTALIDMSAAGLTMDNGLTISITLSNVAIEGGNDKNPANFFGFSTLDSANATRNEDFAFSAGFDVNSTPAKRQYSLAYDGSGDGVNDKRSERVPVNPQDLTEGYIEPTTDTPVTITLTILDDDVVYYLNGKEILTTTLVLVGDNPRADLTAEQITNFGIGSWAGSTANSRSSVKVYDFAIYNGAMNAEQVAALIPEPTTATLSLLALAGLAVRRRRK